jgi:hypothetical protein
MGREREREMKATRAGGVVVVARGGTLRRSLSRAGAVGGEIAR